MYVGFKLAGNIVHQIGENSKSTVLIFMRTLSAFFADACHDAEFLVQFARKTLLWSLSALDLASWKLPETRKFSPWRPTCKQNRAVLSNDRSRDDSFAVHGLRGSSQ